MKNGCAWVLLALGAVAGFLFALIVLLGRHPVPAGDPPPFAGPESARMSGNIRLPNPEDLGIVLSPGAPGPPPDPPPFAVRRQPVPPPEAAPAPQASGGSLEPSKEEIDKMEKKGIIAY